MAVDGIGAQGQPVFSATGADDQAADLTTLGEYALERGGLMRGTTAERNAFTSAGHAVKGDHWYDTTLDVLMVHTGTGWVRTKALAGLILEGSTWDTGAGLFGGGTQGTLWSAGATVGARRITPSVTGRWRVTLNGVWADNSTGMRQAAVRKNGISPDSPGAAGKYAGNLVPAQGRSEFSVSFTTDMNGSTDYVDFSAYQTSGIRLTLLWVSLTAELVH